MRAQAVVAVIFCASIMLAGAPARGYESSTTHPGLTAQAMLQSKRLHAFLRRDLGFGLGLFERLQFLPGDLDRLEWRELRRRLATLDPGGGYRPDASDAQRAAGWLMAGGVLAGMPSSIEEDHFYSPVLKAGLDNRRPIIGSLLGLLSVFEGGNRLRQFLTGTGFDLQGTSALELVRSPGGEYSASVIYARLADAVIARTPRQREHRLVQALLALGGMLHILQDMASPTRTRNDFLPGQLQQLGSSNFDRGSAYERGVAIAYGQLGLPRYTGQPVVRRRLLDFFSSSDWGGLADHTAAENFSPGTVPPPVQILPDTDPRALRRRLASHLPFSSPALGPIDLSCARRRTCHQRGPHGALLAYRIDRENQLHFFIDRTCIAASARRLLPMAVGYSAGAIDFLLRGRLVFELEGQEVLLRNGESPLGPARLRLIVEDAAGIRRVVETRQLRAASAGVMLARVPQPIPPGSRRVLALVDGVDRNGEPLLAAGHLLLPAVSPASQPSSRPASAPAH